MKEDDTWAQTVITVTPEDDATLREISENITLSSPSDTPLILDPDTIVYRRSFTHRQFIDTTELEEENEESTEESKPTKQDAENQTYLQGIPAVKLPVEYEDKSSQTMYMAAPCPPLKYFKDIMTAMGEVPLPSMKKTNATATIISYDPDASLIDITEQLIANLLEEEIEEFESEPSAKEETEMEASDTLHFAITRMFWIIDPSMQIPATTSDKETQTFIRYNNRTGIIYVDNEAQTELTCEPKKSNTMLLSSYRETRDMILSYLEDCFVKGIETSSVTDEILNEIIDKCVERIKYPTREEVAQTIVSYKTGEEQKDVLRRLKLDVVVDPLEASIIVVPLFNDLLQDVCDVVAKNAQPVVKGVLEQVLQRTMVIIAKLVELRTESQPNRMDEIFEKRKKRILESMSVKEKRTISTQTSVTGVLEVKKIEESKEILCSVCKQQSVCHWCSSQPEVESTPREEMKILRTQDILLAYKPCYIVTSQKKDNLQPACPLEVKPKLPAKPKTYRFRNSSDSSRDTIDVCLQPIKKIQSEESFNEWAYVTEATLMKQYSTQESTSSTTQSTMTSINKSISKYCGNLSSHDNNLTAQAANALQILKNTFCTQESCVTSSLKSLKQTPLGKENENSCIKSVCAICSSKNNIKSEISDEEIFCAKQTCEISSKLFDMAIPKKSYGDCFKVIPISLQDPDT